jgi:hypothetical protein
MRTRQEIKYEPEHILGSMMELRNYSILTEKVIKYTEENGWSYVVDALERCRTSEAIVPGWKLKLRPGILRDGMINILGLQAFIGLDVDFLDTFSNIKSNDATEVRKKALEIAHKLLREQVKRGNTFFMDVEKMKENKFAFYVSDIINSRTREIEQLDSKPTLFDVYSTYYGFQLLTSDLTEDGVSTTIKDQLIGILGNIGGVREIKGEQLKLSSHAFRKSSPQQKVLLWNMLRLAMSGIEYKRKALEKLGYLGDSRAIDLLHRYVDGISVHLMDFFDDCLRCLGWIGDPRSFERVHKFHTSNKVSGLNVMAGIKGEKTLLYFKTLVEKQHTLSLVLREYLMRALATTRQRMWIPVYEEFLEFLKTQQDKPHLKKQALESIAWALRNVHPPYDEI